MAYYLSDVQLREISKLCLQSQEAASGGDFLLLNTTMFPHHRIRAEAD